MVHSHLRFIRLFTLFTFFVFFIQPIQAYSFNTGDFAGTWYGHHIVTGDDPPDDPRWGYGTVVMDSQGQYTAVWNSPTQSNEVTPGTIQIDPRGFIIVDNDPLRQGLMSQDKELIVFVDGALANDGNGLVVLNRRKQGQAFATADLAGAWYGHQIVSGDALADEPRWGYGTADINSAGGFTVSWTSANHAQEVSQGAIQINASGMITVNGQSLTHGVMNDAKDMIVFIDGTAQNDGNGLTIMLKRSPAATFSAGDLAGVWCGYHVVSGDDPPDDPRWGYGKVTINSQGQFTAEWTSPTRTGEISQGNVQISATGETLINNNPLTHGVMNDAKNMFVFIDGTTESGGNALNVFLRCSEPSTATIQILLQAKE